MAWQLAEAGEARWAAASAAAGRTGEEEMRGVLQELSEVQGLKRKDKIFLDFYIGTPKTINTKVVENFKIYNFYIGQIFIRALV